jgi:SpoVK/Ycf46/Vps4 family AAA+-type ATPase
MGIINDKDYGLESIKGKSRDALKTEILKFIFTFIQLPKFFMNNFLNIMLLGPAGSGKSKVGGVLSHVFHRLGINTTSNVTMATPQNLIGQFVGQTAVKTRKVLVENLEGVLFIDEAYTLTPCPGATSNSKGSQFNEEAIGELINFMDKFIGCIVIIVAGYENKMMDCFMPFNEGLSRRFPRVMKLTPYSAEDLTTILKSFLEDAGHLHEYLSKSQLAYIAQLIEDTNAHDIYTNQAGDMLNLSKALLEDAIMYQHDYDADAIFQTFVRFAASKRFKLA